QVRPGLNRFDEGKGKRADSRTVINALEMSAAARPGNHVGHSAAGTTDNLGRIRHGERNHVPLTVAVTQIHLQLRQDERLLTWQMAGIGHFYMSDALVLGRE